MSVYFVFVFAKRNKAVKLELVWNKISDHKNQKLCTYYRMISAKLTQLILKRLGLVPSTSFLRARPPFVKTVYNEVSTYP